jgi:hypothetical protein
MENVQALPSDFVVIEPVLTPLFHIPPWVETIDPIQMDWPNYWDSVEQPASLTLTDLVMKAPGTGWCRWTIDVHRKNDIVITSADNSAFLHPIHGHAFLSLLNTYAHKFASRAWKNMP